MNLESWWNQTQHKPTIIGLIGSKVGTRYYQVLSLNVKVKVWQKVGRFVSLISWWNSTLHKPTIIGLIGSMVGARTHQVLAKNV